MRKNLLILICLLTLSGCGQWWNVRPFADFVEAEIRPGDRVRIQSINGRNFDMTVVSVDSNEISGVNDSVRIMDIATLEKYGKTSPANPCSPEVPLGCSVPRTLVLISSSQQKFQKFFYPSCEQHDFCYRHGAATYGESRQSCDQQFFDDLKNQCQPAGVTPSILIRDFDVASCNATAVAYVEAVRQRGENRFLGSNSTYCEYDGPP